MGHLISLVGVVVETKKVQTVLEWPVSTTTKSVRGFLGLAGYYREFIRGFGGIAAPLTRLLTKKDFCWTSEAKFAFTQLKQALTSPPALRLLDFLQSLVVECDACVVLKLSYHNMISQW